MSCRRLRLICALLWLAALAGTLPAAQQPQEAPPAQPPKPAKPAPSPFEAVPTAPEEQPPEPAKPAPFEKPPVAEEAKPAPRANIIEAVEFRGARRVPQDTLRSMIFIKKGDIYDPDQLRRDFMILWNTGRFDDLVLEEEDGKVGRIIRFVVTERRTIRSIKYEGIKSVTVSEILDRFKERRVGLTVESQYDQNRVQRATVVLKEYLAERGRQYAEVTPEVRQIPPSSLEVTFMVKEGPKVKVGDIAIEGNTVLSDKDVIRFMKFSKPIGIPHSLLFENLFARTFDSTKLEADQELIRDGYQKRGYFMARVIDHQITMRDVGGGKFRIPLFYPNKPGKRADLKITLEEGRLYRLNKITFAGVKLFRQPQALMQPLFGMAEGDVFSTEKLRKGMENMRKLYGEFGYIDFVPDPMPEPIPNSDKIDLTISVDEGKQFFVKRIDFSGNTTTRDKVIRRELLLDEGDIYNTRMWELSILRLNQLGYFEKLKEEDAAEIKRDTRNNTVDITLKVKERGKNSIGMTGGVSAYAGTFIGFNYATNNFLGLGEVLSIDLQLGDRLRAITFGFTEPYFLDRPLQLGFSVFAQRYNFDQAREISLVTGRNLIPYYEALGSSNLLNYTSNGTGFSVYTSYPLKRSFARVGLSYSWDTSDITCNNRGTCTYFTYMNFQNLSGPNSLNGIVSSRVVPSYSYNSIDHPITPSKGRSLYVSTAVAGLGGNVAYYQPAIDAKYFRPAFFRSHVIGMHGYSSFISGYGGKSVPPYSRTFMGGENDVRGFEIWSITPVAYMPSEVTIPVRNDDGSVRTQKVITSEGNVVYDPVQITIPMYQVIWPGGDFQAVGNFEYRIPIFGPVTLAAFYDVGVNKILRADQLVVNPDYLSTLNGKHPQAGFRNQAEIAPGTQQARMSTGLELQIMMPVVNAPFRLYYAYNPMVVDTILTPPIVTDPSSFPNSATAFTAATVYAYARRFREDRTMFRFTISRTF